MILINKLTSNKVIVTLLEKQTISPCDYLFEFTNDITNEKKIFTATDLSLAPGRYNEFTIIDSPTENPYNGTMNFAPTGYWRYKIYEMNISSPPDLDPNNAITVLEIGKVLVRSLNPVAPIVFTLGDEPITPVFTLGDPQ